MGTSEDKTKTRSKSTELDGFAHSVLISSSRDTTIVYCVKESAGVLMQLALVRKAPVSNGGTQAHERNG